MAKDKSQTDKAQDEELRPPAWRDKHGRPELRMPRSFSKGTVTPRVTPPKDKSK